MNSISQEHATVIGRNALSAIFSVTKPSTLDNKINKQKGGEWLCGKHHYSRNAKWSDTRAMGYFADVIRGVMRVTKSTGFST